MSKPRIIAGSAKGRSLNVPKRGTRPSPARLREALFNKLAFYERGHFLDLYSGTGAIGLEASSRGWQATCVDLSREAVRTIQGNASRLDLSVEVVRADALDFAQKHPQGFDIVCAAPPYPLDLSDIFQSLLETQVAQPDGLYIFQYPSQLDLQLSWNDLPIILERRVYGSNVLSILKASTLKPEVS